jgi:hypothetical protein
LAWWRGARRNMALRNIAAGMFATSVAFAATTPYFFLDWATARQDIEKEARSVHLGADGFTPRQNLRWYVGAVIPQQVGRTRVTLAAIGILLALWRRKSRQLLLLGFVAAYLMEVSLHPLHWIRWIIPIIPLLMLWAAAALNAVFIELCNRLGLRRHAYAGLLLLGMAYISYGPARAVIALDRLHANPSTRVQAREWIVRNLPPGSRIAQEWYAAALDGTSFDVLRRFSLATGRHVEDYFRAGYRYVNVSDGIDARYFAEPNRYPDEIAFYRELFASQHLLQQFEPSSTRPGPTILIFELHAQASSGVQDKVAP